MIDTILNKIKSEPAVVLAFLAAVIQGLQLEDAISWHTISTVVAGVLIRQFVTPAAKVEEKVEQAHVDGFVLGAGLPPEQSEPGDFG